MDVAKPRYKAITLAAIAVLNGDAAFFNDGDGDADEVDVDIAALGQVLERCALYVLPSPARDTIVAIPSGWLSSAALFPRQRALLRPTELFACGNYPNHGVEFCLWQLPESRS